MSVIDKDNTAITWIHNVVNVEEMFYLFFSIFENRPKKYDGSEPDYELHYIQIASLTKKLKELYPDIYRQLLETRTSFLGLPKQRSHPSYSNKLGSFDPSKDY
jgi:uncharacterized membrane-anchored protein YhcB (DUF1043 family)